MLRSERRSLIRFLVIYLTSTFLLFSIASWVYYTASKHHLLDKQREFLKYEAQQLESQLRILHRSEAKKLIYPKIKQVDSAIYDLDKHYIFGTYTPPISLENLHDKKRLFHIVRIEPYYLGAAYLLVSKPIDFAPIEQLQQHILLFMAFAGILFSILGYFLGKLFIEPMRNAMNQMNHFIQDTTHELNTPISTILTNIEMIETFDKCKESRAELDRINIASRTLSRIYDDLTYLNLNHDYHRTVIILNMCELIEERLRYFSVMIEAKKLKMHTDIQADITLSIDRNDAIRLIDNLLSNAIKYNRIHGELFLQLTQDMFLLKDTGSGISPKDLTTVLQRFKRANSSEGGFGIGLDIVDQIVRYYRFEFQMTSKENEGTEVIVIWKK